MHIHKTTTYIYIRGTQPSSESCSGDCLLVSPSLQFMKIHGLKPLPPNHSVFTLWLTSNFTNKDDKKLLQANSVTIAG